MTRWYPYTVWTWVTGVWDFVCATSDRGAALQMVRALQAFGYNDDRQRAVLAGPRTIVQAYRLRLAWHGTDYWYGDVDALSWHQEIALRALVRLIPDASGYVENLTRGYIALWVTERDIYT